VIFYEKSHPSVGLNKKKGNQFRLSLLLRNWWETQMKIKSVKKAKRYNKRKTKKANVVEVLSPKQTMAIEGVENPRDKAIILLMLNTGLRLTEVVDLNYGDVFDDLKTLSLPSQIKVVGKGNKERVIALNNMAKTQLLSLHHFNRNTLGIRGITKTSPLLLSNRYKRLTPRAIQYAVRASLSTHPHVLRHTCFTNMMKSGVEGVVIQKAAGHSEFSTTAKYYLSVTGEDIQTAYSMIG